MTDNIIDNLPWTSGHLISDCDTNWADKDKYGIPVLSSDYNWKNYVIKYAHRPIYNKRIITTNAQF